MTRALVILGALAAALWAQPPADRIWSGIYTSQQAERGKTNYGRSCSNCHNGDLAGNDRGPALKGDRFLGNWLNGSVGSLYSKIRFYMPATYPESVPENEKIDILAFLLQVNGFPEGEDELKLDQAELDRIPIVRQGQTGIANFSLVSVVGCLEPGPANAWMLARSTEPVVVDADRPDAASTEAARGRVLGEQRFRLVSAGAFARQLRPGEKVEARGLYYREPGDNRLNVTGLALTGVRCGEAVP
jgi:mono/diheme cytochrome c family protein